MNAAQWRGHGYKTIFRDGKIYLYRPLTGVLISTDVDHGKWMRQDNVNHKPWRTHPDGIDGMPQAFRDDVFNTLVVCYCAYGMTCDFCAGRRTPPPREKRPRFPMYQRAVACVERMTPNELHAVRIGLIPAWCSEEQLGGRAEDSTWPLLTAREDVKNLALSLFERLREFDELGV